jgi:hypothetical protein
MAGRCRGVIGACLGAKTVLWIAFFGCGAALAAPPDGADANSVIGRWFQSLRSPDTGSSCCSPQQDCRQIDQYRPSVEPGGYEALYQGEWVKVPAKAVLERTDNPTGRAVICIMHINGEPIARCFVRAAEG